jgi:hypothetical protein
MLGLDAKLAAATYEHGLERAEQNREGKSREMQYHPPGHPSLLMRYAKFARSPPQCTYREEKGKERLQPFFSLPVPVE